MLKTNEKIIQLLKQRFQGEDGVENFQHAREHAFTLIQQGCLKDARELLLQLQEAEPTNLEIPVLLSHLDTLLN